MEGVYLVRVSYRLHFQAGTGSVAGVLHDEDLVYDRVGPFQQEMGLMELERKYGDLGGKARCWHWETQVWMMKTREQGWRSPEPDPAQQG